MENVVYKLRRNDDSIAEFEILNIDVKDDALLCLTILQDGKQIDFDMNLRELKSFNTFIYRCIDFIEEEQSKL